MPPEPEHHTDSPKNNDFWLDQIGNHSTWPIMQFRKTLGLQPDPNGELEVFSHDTDDKHLGNMMLFPQEMQHQISEAARHTLAFRQTEAGKHKPDIIVPGDDEDKDPLAYNQRGTSVTGPKYRSGINVIDDITDNGSYMGLLSTLVNMSDEEIEISIGESGSIVANLNDQRRMIGDVANFNTRHREGRRITEEELQTVQDQYVQGILRVANKIRGESATVPHVVAQVSSN